MIGLDMLLKALEDMIILYLYASLFIVFAIALYGVLVKPNLIKKIIALTIMADTANTIIILVGYRKIPWPKPPVLPTLTPSPRDILAFLDTSVDPLPQALVITAIVINLAITAFLVTLAIQVYRLYGTLDYRKIREIRRGIV